MDKITENDIPLLTMGLAALVATLPARKRLRWMRRMRRMLGDTTVVSIVRAKDQQALRDRYERLLPFMLDHQE